MKDMIINKKSFNLKAAFDLSPASPDLKFVFRSVGKSTNLKLQIIRKVFTSRTLLDHNFYRKN